MIGSKIDWTDHTWNPVVGCKRVSKGCMFCYAHTIAEKFRGSAAYPNGFDLQIKPNKLRDPLNIKKPAMFFVNSMSDLFWGKISDDYVTKVIEVIREADWHQFQVLTKRPNRMASFSNIIDFPDNMWCGVSTEDQKTTERIDILKTVKCKIKFISYEPLLELIEYDLNGIDWVIVGGESGRHLFKKADTRGLAKQNPKTKTWDPIEQKVDWVRTIRDECAKHSIPFFFKQWGGSRHDVGGFILDGEQHREYPLTNLTVV